MDLIDLEIHLPWPPSVNHYYVHTRNGIFVSKKGKEYRKLIKEYIFEQCGKVEINKNMMIIPILYPPDRRIRDLDNYKKALLDSITHSGLWQDDSLIDQDFTFRGSVVKHGKVTLFIQDAGLIIPVSNPRIVKKILSKLV